MNYSDRLKRKILSPQFAGILKERMGMRLCIGSEGERKQGARVTLYLLIDEMDGVIADVKFGVFGPAALIGAAEVLSELLMRKNVSQASRISASLIESNTPFPPESHGFLNQVLFALENALEKARDLASEELYVPSPVGHDLSEKHEVPGWEALSEEKQIAIIEEVVAKEIRPFIELDEGNVKILSVTKSRLVAIAYEGACTSCPSAIGGTLGAIQEILQAKVYPDLVVQPDLSLLTL